MTTVLNTPIIHPGILAGLASAGHKSMILVTDGYFAASTTTGPNADRVYLNLEAGSPTVTRVVELIARMVPIEGCSRMTVPAGGSDEVQVEVQRILGDGVPCESLERDEFYASARSVDLALCIVTGDTRRFANVLLRVGPGTAPS
ncbi:MAG TPA: RbsD/FucU domain-containing protein [Galbitalea sp.]|jgi:L-fucose mutarotase|nr:RbsD/FucU domain-containing protein [Galbitalea sp.]